MATLPLTPIASPLRVDESGTIRVGPTRVTLDTVISSYSDGNSAEEIVLQYPSLSLVDVYTTVAYYLSHRDEVEDYLRQRRAEAGEIRKEIQQLCDQRGVRERLLAQAEARKSGS